MITPIIILSLDRPLQLKEMIDSIVSNTEHETFKIIICDNASATPEMICYLSSIEHQHTIIRNSTNMGIEGFNSGLALVDVDFFILSDPDIVLQSGIPKNWIEIYRNILEEIPTPKIGPSLSLFNLSNDTFGTNIYRCEGGMRSRPAISKYLKDIPAWHAPIDTTLALYRRDSFHDWINKTLQFRHGITIIGPGYLNQESYNSKYHMLPIRVGGPFEAIHTGWDTSGKYSKDNEYYEKNCNLTLASTSRWLLYNVGPLERFQVLVINLNNLNFTMACIADLMRQTDMNYGLTVVDNASSENGTQEFFECLEKNKIKIIKYVEREPLCHIWNKFYDDNQRAELLCFLNNDVRIPVNFIRSTKDVFDKEPDVKIAGHATNNLEYGVCSDILSYKIYYRRFRQGWDFTLRKSSYKKIPEQIKVYFGDDWIYSNIYNENGKAAIILNSPIWHNMGGSCGSLTGNEYELDRKEYLALGYKEDYSMWSGVSIVKPKASSDFVKMNFTPLITICLVTYARYEEIKRILNEFQHQTQPYFVVEVWQDGKDDKKRSIVESLNDHRIVYKENTQRQNKYGHDMRHRSVMECQTKWWTTTNDDNSVSPLYVEEVLKASEKHVGIIKYSVVMENIPWKGKPSFYDGGEHLSNGVVDFDFFNNLTKTLDPDLDILGDVDAASFAIRPEIMRKYGGWHSELFEGDWIVYKKLLEAGVPIKRIRKALALHR